MNALSSSRTSTRSLRPGRPRLEAWLLCAGTALLASSLVTPVASATGTVPGCGSVVTHDITLTHDLVCTGDGLVVGADHVRIDLGGHAVIGKPGVGTGVQVQDRRGVVIAHGTISSFDAAMVVSGGGGNQLRQLVVEGQTGIGLLLIDTDQNRVLDNRVRDIADGQGTGVQLFQSHDNDVRGNLIQQAGDGISLDRSNRNVVGRNTSSHNGAGIGLFDSSVDNVVSRNRTDANGDTGVLLDRGADDNLIVANSARGNAFAGIAVGASDRVVVTRNRTSANLGSGIAIGDGAHETVVTRNLANRNGFSPFGCQPDCPLLDDGIHVDVPGTVLGRNVANLNSDLGIQGVAGVDDIGRNRARRNGDVGQCTFVMCS